MTKNLETADTIVKLALAGFIIALFFMKVIAGPVAVALVVLSFLILLIYAARLIFRKLFSRGQK